MSYRVTRRGVEIPRGSPLAVDVHKDLTVAPVCLNGFPEKIRVFLETPTKYIVPLHWARSKGLKFDDTRSRGQSVELSFHGSLRRDLRQQEAVTAVIDTWKTNGGGALMCLPVGFGKSTCALYLASVVKKKTLVMVHKSFLKDQWIERARQVLGIEATVIQGDTFDDSGPVVVAMIQTLVSRKFDPRAFEAFGLVIVDEVHHIAATGFSQSMWAQCAPFTLGLSATPRRADGLMKVVEWFCGPVAFLHRRTDQKSTCVTVVKYTCAAYADPPPTNRRGDICHASVMTALVSDEVRTARIAREIAKMPDKHVLVLTHRRRHVYELAEAVRAAGIESVGTYVGGDKTCPDTRVIVATYALTSEGFDVPRLNALVLATPASDVEQACGRVMRGSATAGAIIVDVLDDWGVCWAQHAKRKAFYKKSGFTLGVNDERPEPKAPKEPLFLSE